jgi:hypothetical protein
VRFNLKKQSNMNFLNSILLPSALCLFMGVLEARAASLEAPFVRITNSVLSADLDMSISCAWGDFDNDGWLDLFVGNYQGSNSLFHNNGDGTFTKITTGRIATDPPTHASGVWADFNNDAQLDLIVANLIDTGPSLFVYRGTNGALPIRMTAAEVGTLASDSGRVAAASLADYDGDGYLDLFAAKGALVRDISDALYHNDGNGRFTLVTNSILNQALRSCQGAWADVDNDGKPDLFVTHAADEGNFLLRNLGFGQFTNVTSTSGLTNRGDSVGATWGDYDNCGRLDLFVTNLRLGGVATKNFLYHNQGDGTFLLVTNGDVANDTGHFLSCSWVDYDNDGWLDLFVTYDPPGVPPASAVKNRLYHNQGDGTFVMVTSGSLVTDYAHAGGAGWGDYDNDGFPDVFISNGTIFEPEHNALYRNQGNSNNWIKLRCTGTLSNRSAIGTKVRVKAKIGGVDRWQMRQITGGEGWLSFNSLEVIVGLGDASVIDTLRLEWPSGVVQELHNVAAKQILEIVEPIQVASTQLGLRGPGTVDLLLTGNSTRPFHVNATSDLIHWAEIPLDARQGGRLSFTDPEAQTAAARFYRVWAP